jgi:hypothetical protein
MACSLHLTRPPSGPYSTAYDPINPLRRCPGRRGHLLYFLRKHDWPARRKRRQHEHVDLDPQPVEHLLEVVSVRPRHRDRVAAPTLSLCLHEPSSGRGCERFLRSARVGGGPSCAEGRTQSSRPGPARSPRLHGELSGSMLEWSLCSGRTRPFLLRTCYSC